METLGAHLVYLGTQKHILSVLGDDDLKAVFDVGLVSSPLRALRVLYHEERAHLCFPTVVKMREHFQREIKVHLSFITTQMNPAFLPRHRERERETYQLKNQDLHHFSKIQLKLLTRKLSCLLPAV